MGRNGVVCCLRMTSSSDRRAIESPKAGNVRKTRQCAHRSPSACSSSPRIRFWWGMRCCGKDDRSEGLFKQNPVGRPYPADHPLRMSRPLVHTALAELSRAFAKLYARDGRPSIPPERLLRELLLQALGDRCAHCRVLWTLPAFGRSIARRSLDEVPSS